MKNKLFILPLIAIVVVVVNLSGSVHALQYIQMRPLEQVIKASVPMAEFLTYAPDLRSITGGRGIFTMEFSHYDEVPAQISQKLIEELSKSKE